MTTLYKIVVFGFLFFLIFFRNFSIGQNIGVNTDGSSPSTLFHTKNTIAGQNNYLRIENTQGGYQSALQLLNTGTSNADWIWYIPGGTTEMRLYRGADLVTFLANGNVGIGTTVPSTPLHIVGTHPTTQFRLTLPSGSNGGGTGEVNLQLWASEPGITWDAGGIGTNVTNNNGSPAGFGRINTSLGQSYIRFITNGGAMALNTTDNAGTYYQTMYMAGGNVGIGTTTLNAKLNVIGGGQILATNGSSSNTRTLTILENGDAQTNFGAYPGAWTSALQIQDNTAPASRFLWFSPLDNGSGSNARIRAAGSGLDIYTGGGNDAGNFSASFASTGNVGIGNTTASYKLDVTGDTRTTGKFFGHYAVDDTRNANSAPTAYNNEVSFDFKDRSVVGVGGSGTYSGMITMAPWGDNSGDASHQLNFNEGGIFWRQGQPDGGSWDAWTQILTSSIAPTGSGSTNYLARWTSATALGTGICYDNGTNLGVGTTSLSYKLTVNGPVGNIDNAGSYGQTLLQTWGLSSGGTMYLEPAGGSSLYLTDSWSNTGMLNVQFGRTAFERGNVGIGSSATSPAVPLSVGGNGTNVYATDVWVENNMHVQGNEALTQGGRGRMRVGTAWSYVGLYADASSTGVANDLVLGASSSQVRIGCNGCGQNLLVNGRIKTNGINESSDIRFKKNIAPLLNSLEKVEKLNGVNYFWRSDEFTSMKNDTGIQIGLIAQELEKIFPELVKNDEEGYKSIEYSHLVPVLIEAIKELKAEVDSLKKTNFTNNQIAEIKIRKLEEDQEKIKQFLNLKSEK